MSADPRDENLRNLERSPVFLAIITPNVAESKHTLELMEYAFALKKPMIAVVAKGTDMSPYKKYPWRKVIYLDDNLDFPEKELVQAIKEAVGT